MQQEKQAAFGLLAAGIAHEVGNPLAAISSLVQMLNRRPNDDYTRERLQMVDDQLRRIQGTLRELVDFSRPATTQKSMCDVHELIDAALNIAKYYKRTKGKKIVTGYAERLPLLRVVRDQLVQVFLNLILNAMDATEEGGTIEITTALVCGLDRSRRARRRPRHLRRQPGPRVPALFHDQGDRDGAGAVRLQAHHRRSRSTAASSCRKRLPPGRSLPCF